MLAAPIASLNSWNQDSQTIGFGNYGYEIYSQDVEVHRNPFTSRVNVERDLDFIPLGNSYFAPYTSFPAAYHPHYHN